MHFFKITSLASLLCGAFLTAEAKIDLVTLPNRDDVELTIYNSADLTLARENRTLTLLEGSNRLEFSWANTLIDPTSLHFTPQQNGDKLTVSELVFPPRIQNTGIWNIDSEAADDYSVSIKYLTSGLSWRAFYMGTLTEDESHMQLQGYVRVQNNSGEDYENAKVRLVVGKVNLLDQIAKLAKRKTPYGKPGPSPVTRRERDKGSVDPFASDKEEGMVLAESVAFFSTRMAPKAIVKEGLSEYFVYTIEGRETIPNGWAKRLPSFTAKKVPVKNLYKFDPDRFGNQVLRFLSFTNDEEHDLGDTPIPGGGMRVYRSLAQAGDLAFEGSSNFQYIPVGEEVELNLGNVSDVIVETELMNTETLNYEFDKKGNVAGWDERKTVRCQLKNTRSVAVKTEITQNFYNNHWELEKEGDYGQFEKLDLQRVRFTTELNPLSNKEFSYTVTTHHGTRQE